MAAASDLVMPKLGLTMTEGRVARWAVAVGERFAKGDCVVEIETDKIVNEVEAPSGGTMLLHLAAAGDDVAVGTVIGRWQLDHAATPPAASVDARIIATPYARRLARQAGVALAGIEGSGPNGRIKAADVLQAEAGRSMPPGGEPQPPARIVPADVALRAEPLTRRPAALSPTGPALSFAVADIDAGRLDEIERGLQRGGARRLDRGHLVAIACLRALERAQPSRGEFVLGIARADGIAAVEAPAGLSGAALSGQLGNVSSGAAGGDIVVDVRASMIRLLAPTVPPGWGAVVTLGAARPMPRPAADGGVVWGRELALALSYDASRFGQAEALALLDDLGSALEDPLHLLAS